VTISTNTQHSAPFQVDQSSPFKSLDIYNYIFSETSETTTRPLTSEVFTTELHTQGTWEQIDATKRSIPSLDPSIDRGNEVTETPGASTDYLDNASSNLLKESTTGLTTATSWGKSLNPKEETEETSLWSSAIDEGTLVRLTLSNECHIIECRPGSRKQKPRGP
jgi:hypothetical protein